MFPEKQKNQPQATSQLPTSSGFTLIEILLVTFIAGLVFIGIYLLYAMTIKQDVESRYEIIASNLAQEGIEIIRNARDEYILAGDDIDDNWDNTNGASCRPYVSASGDGDCTTAMGYKPEVGWITASNRYANCTSNNCSAAGEILTPFERECSINAQDSDADGTDDTLIVTCTVSWDSFVNPAINRNIEATSVLTDWDAD